MKVILSIFERLSGVDKDPLYVDITADVIGDSAEDFSKSLIDVELFKIDANDLTLELLNHNHKYFSPRGSALYEIKGSSISDEGRYAFNWRMEKVTVYNDLGKIRFMGFIFASDNPITCDSALDVISFTVYDPMYLLKLFKLSKHAPSYLGSTNAIRYRERYIREIDVLAQDGSVVRNSVLHIMDKAVYDAIPQEEQVRWEKVFLYDTFGGLSVESGNLIYDIVDLSTTTPLVGVGAYNVYSRRALAPTEISIAGVGGLIETFVKDFNSWCPIYKIRLETSSADMDALEYSFLIELDFDTEFSQLDIYNTLAGGSVQRYFFIAFSDGGDTDEGKFKSVKVVEVFNYVNLFEIIGTQFPNFKPAEDVYFNFRMGGSINPAAHHHDATVKVPTSEWVPSTTVVNAGVIKNPSYPRLLYCWRLLKRIYTRTVSYMITPFLFYYVDIRVAQYCWQYLAVDLYASEGVNIWELVNNSTVLHHITGNLVTDEEDNLEWNDYNSLVQDPGDEFRLILAKPGYTPAFDTNSIAGWPLTGHRFYSPTKAGPGIFYFGSPIIDAVALDYRDKTLGDALLDFAKLTNSMFRLIPPCTGLTVSLNEGSLFFARRNYGASTFTIQDPKAIISHTEERFNLIGDPTPEISSDIIGSANYNKALSKFYGVFFGANIVGHDIEVTRDDKSENSLYDIMWQLNIQNQNLGIIHKLEHTPLSVKFETRRYPFNRNIRGLS